MFRQQVLHDATAHQQQCRRRYPSMHKEETRKKLMGNARVIAKRGGFGTTRVDELMASMGLNGGAFYGHFPTKEAADS